jgi:hypothetical protein
MSGDIRRWLSKHQPDRVRAEMPGSDEPRIVKVGLSRSRWRDAAEALAGCLTAEALDPNGAVLGVWTASADEIAAADGAATTGKGSELVLIAQLIADSNDRAVQRHAEIVRMSVEQMGLLVQVLSGRLQALEKAYHTMIMQGPEQDPNAGMVQTLLSAAAPGFAQSLLASGQPKTPPPNGSKGK